MEITGSNPLWYVLGPSKHLCLCRYHKLHLMGYYKERRRNNDMKLEGSDG